MRTIISSVIVLAAMSLFCSFSPAEPLGHRFSYQGYFEVDGQPYSGLANITFSLWDSPGSGSPPTGGIEVAFPETLENVNVVNGVFTVFLGLNFFGSFNGDERWIQVTICPTGCVSPTTLAPRQLIAGTPYALAPWLTQDGNLTYSNGKVGIGLDLPSNQLEVLGQWDGIYGHLGLTGDKPTIKFDSDVGGISAKWIMQQNSIGTGLGFYVYTSPHIPPPTWAPVLYLSSVAGSHGVGIGTDQPHKELTVAGSMEIGVNQSDYRHLRMGGGNSYGYLYGSYAGLGDGIHLGYNYYANPDGSNVFAHVDGQNSRISVGYGNIRLATAGTGVAPIDRWTMNSSGNISAAGKASYANGTVQIYYEDENPDAGGVKVANADGSSLLIGTGTNGKAGFGAVSSDGQTIVGGLWRDGPSQLVLEAGLKISRHLNPNNLKTDIVYASLEGPEAAMYVRGTAALVDGRATIQLPDHFRALASEQGLTVQLTPLAETNGLFVASKRLDGIEVRESRGGTGSFDFDWEVKAVRRDSANLKVVRDWRERLIPGASEEQAWAERANALAQ